MRKPVLNILGFALVTTILSIIAVKSSSTGKFTDNQDLSSLANESEQQDIASICERIERLSDNVKQSGPQSISVDTCISTFSDDPDELETEAESNDYRVNYISEDSEGYEDGCDNAPDDDNINPADVE